MALRVSQKVIGTTVNVLTTNTDIVTLTKLFGCRGIKIIARNSADANNVAIAAVERYNGVDIVANSKVLVRGTGAIANVNPVPFYVFEVEDGSSTTGPWVPMTCDEVKIQASKTVAAGNVTFDIFVLHDVETVNSDVASAVASLL